MKSSNNKSRNDNMPLYLAIFFSYYISTFLMAAQLIMDYHLSGTWIIVSIPITITLSAITIMTIHYLQKTIYKMIEVRS